MTPGWKLRATTIEGGFALRVLSAGDPGAAWVPDAVLIEMEDGQMLSLDQALVRLIQSHCCVTGFNVFVEPREQERLP